MQAFRFCILLHLCLNCKEIASFFAYFMIYKAIAVSWAGVILRILSIMPS